MITPKTALITGATSGIGLALAHELGKRGYSLVLTGLDPEASHLIAEELANQYKIQTKYVAMNLEDPESPQRLFMGLEQMGTTIDVLVNNAGFGKLGKFWESSIEAQLSMVSVNIEAVLRLTQLFLPRMLHRQNGRILMTASVAGFVPGPNLAVYHATKAFLLSFSEALATELEGTGVTVTALCPGATDTDFFLNAGMLETEIFQKGSLAKPEEVASAAIDGLLKGSRVVVPGALNKTMVFSRRFLSEKALAKSNKKAYQKVSPNDVRKIQIKSRKRK
ncbi:MAG: SDR family oxidoreductase [Verrucomicrobiota bacterium]